MRWLEGAYSRRRLLLSHHCPAVFAPRALGQKATPLWPRLSVHQLGQVASVRPLSSRAAPWVEFVYVLAPPKWLTSTCGRNNKWLMAVVSVLITPMCTLKTPIWCFTNENSPYVSESMYKGSVNNTTVVISKLLSFYTWFNQRKWFHGNDRHSLSYSCLISHVLQAFVNSVEAEGALYVNPPAELICHSMECSLCLLQTDSLSEMISFWGTHLQTLSESLVLQCRVWSADTAWVVLSGLLSWLSFLEGRVWNASMWVSGWHEEYYSEVRQQEKYWLHHMHRLGKTP